MNSFTCKNQKHPEIRFFTTSHWPDNYILTKKADAGTYKISSPGFSGDMEALLGKETICNQVAAFEWLKSELIEKI